MIVAPLLGAALVVNVATSPLTGPVAGVTNLTLQQKAAATEPLVRSATDCIVHAVASDPRFTAEPHNAVGDLIVESIRSCRTPVRAMIDAYAATMARVPAKPFSWGLISTCCPRQ